MMTRSIENRGGNALTGLLRSPEHLLAILLVGIGLWMGFFDTKHQVLMIFAGIYLIAAMGLNLLSGYLGIISIAHGALVCLGAYAAGIATVSYGVPFWPATLLAVLVGMGAGVLLGLPALRLSSWYFVLITLAFTMLVPALLVDFRDFTGGYSGVVGIPTPSFPMLDMMTGFSPGWLSSRRWSTG